jgi:hypothetical protein
MLWATRRSDAAQNVKAVGDETARDFQSCKSACPMR